MEEKLEKTCTREEMADILEKLAAQLRSGSAEIEQQVRQVPENLEMKVHVKEKKGRVRYRVEWRWSSLEDYDEAARGQLLEQQQSFKQIKKNLALAFKQLKRALPEGVSPDDAVVPRVRGQHSGLRCPGRTRMAPARRGFHGAS